MTTFCNQCGKVELCEVCHDTFYDSHPFSTGSEAVQVVSSLQQGSKITEQQMAEQVKDTAVVKQTRFIHSQAANAVVTSFGRMYYRNGWTCAFIEVDTSTVLIGVATCGGNDVFNKRIGRLIAEGRMKKHPIIISKTAEERAWAVAREYAEEMYYDDDFDFDPVGANTVDEVEEVHA